MKFKTILSTVMFVSLWPILVLAQGTGPGCDESYRECVGDFSTYPSVPQIPCSGNFNYDISGPVNGYLYACRGHLSDCPGADGDCNVIYRYDVLAYTLYCSGTDETTFCLQPGTGLTNETATDTACNRQPCDTNGVDYPDDVIPPNQDPNASFDVPWPRR